MKKLPLLLLIPLLWGCVTPPSPGTRLATLYPPDRPFAESRFASFGGLRLHYRTWSPDDESKGKVLLIHDEGASTVSFRFLGPQLASAGYSVVAVDLPGFGFSDPGLNFAQTLENRSGLLWSLADRLDTESNSFGPADRWIIAGHGMGGAVATQMAIERPNRTEGLVLIAAPIAKKSNPSAGFWFPPVRWAWNSWLRNSVFTIDGVRELLGKAYGRTPTDEEVDLYAAPLLRAQAVPAFMHYRETAGPTAFDLASVGVPSLVVWGDADAWNEPTSSSALAEALPNAALAMIPGAGHLPMETDVQATLDAITSWASRL